MSDGWTRKWKVADSESVLGIFSLNPRGKSDARRTTLGPTSLRQTTPSGFNGSHVQHSASALLLLPLTPALAL